MLLPLAGRRIHHHHPADPSATTAIGSNRDASSEREGSLSSRDIPDDLALSVSSVFKPTKD